MEDYGYSPEFKKELEHLAEMKRDNFISDRDIANFAMDLWSMKPGELWKKLMRGE